MNLSTTNIYMALLLLFSFSTKSFSNENAPIELSSFEAVAESEGVRIIWITNIENPNASFDIEKSYDGNQFMKIAYLSSSKNNSYTYLDKNEKRSVVYYRIKTYSSSGIIATSKTILFNKEEAYKIEISPNPCRNQDRLFIKINNTFNSDCDIAITNPQGDIVFKYQFSPSEITMPEFALQPGMYYIQISSAGDKVTKKFIIE